MTSEPLAKDLERQLRIWLKKPERKTLDLIISSRGKAAEADALKHALVGGEQNDRLFESAVKIARLYEEVADMLRELDDDTKPIQIVKIK